SLRHRCHLGRRRALARHLGGRRERFAASRSSNRRGPGKDRDAAWTERFRTRVRWRRSVLLRGRKERKGEGRSPARAKWPVAGGAGAEDRRRRPYFTPRTWNVPIGVALPLTMRSTACRPGFGLRVVCTARDTAVENGIRPRAGSVTRFSLKTLADV